MWCPWDYSSYKDSAVKAFQWQCRRVWQFDTRSSAKEASGGCDIWELKTLMLNIRQQRRWMVQLVHLEQILIPGRGSFVQNNTRRNLPDCVKPWQLLQESWTQMIVSSHMQALVAGRFIPLYKSPDVRPFGIGKVLRWIVSNATVTVLEPEMMGKKFWNSQKQEGNGKFWEEREEFFRGLIKFFLVR